MEGSAVFNYLNYKIDCSYTYFKIIWETLESKIKLSRNNRKIVHQIIKYMLAKGELKELFEGEEISRKLTIETNSKIVQKQSLLIIADCATCLSSYSSDIKSNITSTEAIKKIKIKLEKVYSTEELAYLKKEEKKLKKAFAVERKTLKRFWNNTTNDVFEVISVPIFGIDLSSSQMMDTKLKWMIKDIDKENKNAVNKILAKYGIQDELTIIALYEIELLLLKSLNNKKYISKVFVDLNDEFFKNKKNIIKLQQIMNSKFLKSKINLRISSFVLGSYSDELSLLKEKEFEFSLNEMVNMEEKSLNKILTYCFEEYEKIKDSKGNKEYCKKNNINVVITNVSNNDKIVFCQKNVGDFFRKT